MAECCGTIGTVAAFPNRVLAHVSNVPISVGYTCGTTYRRQSRLTTVIHRDVYFGRMKMFLFDFFLGAGGRESANSSKNVGKGGQP